MNMSIEHPTIDHPIWGLPRFDTFMHPLVCAVKLEALTLGVAAPPLLHIGEKENKNGKKLNIPMRLRRNEGVRKYIGVPLNSSISRVFHCKPSIWVTLIDGNLSIYSTLHPKSWAHLWALPTLEWLLPQIARELTCHDCSALLSHDTKHDLFQPRFLVESVPPWLNWHQKWRWFINIIGYVYIYISFLDPWNLPLDLDQDCRAARFRHHYFGRFFRCWFQSRELWTAGQHGCDGEQPPGD